ncbi:hypothetical protein Rhal01_02162 [Rubritalea halochordaticola]|uniref:Uncharacterized protein n=1 Tax=Rubritalea halochordaticola TaxID=714537 RepID=A0ABP9V4H4_9BACT
MKHGLLLALSTLLNVAALSGAENSTLFQSQQGQTSYTLSSNGSKSYTLSFKSENLQDPPASASYAFYNSSGKELHVEDFTPLSETLKLPDEEIIVATGVKFIFKEELPENSYFVMERDGKLLFKVKIK